MHDFEYTLPPPSLLKYDYKYSIKSTTGKVPTLDMERHEKVEIAIVT